ncbi:hypothetical protein ABCR94_14435 [Streptomyces sp. 21So2-11]
MIRIVPYLTAPGNRKAASDDPDAACDLRKTLVGTTGFEPATP